ncbi:hypothetical protein JOC75_000979 [Metabacillus crassostreae]|nr:hypothetical protein [Metabacillus crassostreae]MBM7603009.1 hypothetical protein [Metabacillus crassostreae]
MKVFGKSVDGAIEISSVKILVSKKIAGISNNFIYCQNGILAVKIINKLIVQNEKIVIKRFSVKIEKHKKLIVNKHFSAG